MYKLTILYQRPKEQQIQDQIMYEMNLTPEQFEKVCDFLDDLPTLAHREKPEHD